MSLYCVDFRCVHRFQILNVCNQYVTLPNSSRVQKHIREIIQVRLSFQTDGLLTGPFAGKYSTNEPNGIIGSIKRFSKTSFIWGLPIRQEILNVTQIGIYSIPWNLPTIFSSRPDCNSTSDVPSFTLRPALSAIQFVSDRCVVLTYNDSRRDLHKLC